LHDISPSIWRQKTLRLNSCEENVLSDLVATVAKLALNCGSWRKKPHMHCKKIEIHLPDVRLRIFSLEGLL